MRQSKQFWKEHTQNPFNGTYGVAHVIQLPSLLQLKQLAVHVVLTATHVTDPLVLFCKLNPILQAMHLPF